MNQNKAGPPSPTVPRNGRGHTNGHVSQRGLLSIAMLLLSMGALGIAMLGGMRLILDVFGAGLEKSIGGIGAKVIVIGLAYMVGWLAAMIAIRIYGNLVLPLLIYGATWAFLIGICVLYILILQRLYNQGYDLLHYFAYLTVMAAGLVAMVGLHLIIEDHDLRPFAIPLLIISLIQLGLIVIRYVFTTSANASYLWKDIFFFIAMSVISTLMLAHLGILEPLRGQFTSFFDRSSKSIHTQD
ncbi:MAG: hypothetical protein QM730_03880 [Anaerolineales bacterium]